MAGLGMKHLNLNLVIRVTLFLSRVLILKVILFGQTKIEHYFFLFRALLFVGLIIQDVNLVQIKSFFHL